MENIYIVRCGESALKGKNKPYFERMLVQRIKKNLKEFEGTAVERVDGLIFVRTPESVPADGVLKKVGRVFGVDSVSPAVEVCIEGMDAEAALNNANAALRGTRSEIDATNRQLKTAASGWTALGESATAAGKALQNSSRTTGMVGRAFSTMITAPVTGLGTAALKASIDFESSFAGVRKTVDATEEEFAELAAASKEMSTQVAAGTDVINAVMATGGQLGIANEHLREFTKVMIDLGIPVKT